MKVARVLRGFAIAALFVACGVHTTETDESESAMVVEGGVCRTVRLVASNGVDDEGMLSPLLRFTIPDRAELLTGNNGTHWTTFSYRDGADAAIVTCSYKVKGGSGANFQSCSNGATAGSTVYATWVKLTRDSGNSGSVRLTLSEVAPCAGADAGAQDASLDADAARDATLDGPLDGASDVGSDASRDSCAGPRQPRGLAGESRRHR